MHRPYLEVMGLCHRTRLRSSVLVPVFGATAKQQRLHCVQLQTADSPFILGNVMRDLKTPRGLFKVEKTSEEEAMSAYY